MIMKSLWEKASEYGTYAKGYLKGDEDKKKLADIEEVEKSYSEKFNNLKKEIEIFQNNAVHNFEEKISHLNELVDKLNKENESTANDNKALREDNSKIKEENNKLTEKLSELEEKYNLLEKTKNEFSTEIIKLKENQIKENYIQNFDLIKKEITDVSEKLKGIVLPFNEEELKNYLQETTEKINEYVKSKGENEEENEQEEHEDKEEKQEFITIREEIIKSLTEKLNEKINQIQTSNKEHILTICDKITISLEDNLKNLNEKLSEYSNQSEQVNKENENYKNQITTLREEILNLHKNIENMKKETEKLSEDNKTREKALNQTVTSLKEIEQNLNKEKRDLEYQLEISIGDIKSLKEKEEMISNLNTKLKEDEEKLIQENKDLENSINKIKTTFKQFFLMLLEDDIFIDIIEQTFNNINSDSFFEEVYKLSKMIKPKIQFQIYNSFISEKDLLDSLSKYNLDSDVESLIQDYSNLTNIDQIKKIESEDEKESFILKLINELVSYIESLKSTTLKQSKTITELNSQLKSAKETLEESKKNDVDKYDLLNKHIGKLQQDCRENVKTEKMLRETVEHLESNIKDLKSDNEKISSKLKSLNNMYEDLSKEKTNLTEKMSSVSQQCELFKIENTELLEKTDRNSDDVYNLKEKIDMLNKDKSELVNKLSEMEKLKATLHEKIDIISQKDLEINKLKNSYMDVEEFMDNLKLEKEHAAEMFKKQIFEMASELDELKETIRLHEDKSHTEPSLDLKKYEDREHLITDLEIENKHLKEQKDKMKKYSEEILLKVKNDLKDTEFLIDKRMISNILMKYFDFNTDGKIRLALLDTLANFMGFNNDERRKLGLSSNIHTPVKTSSNNNNDKLKDLSDELYDFILNA